MTAKYFAPAFLLSARLSALPYNYTYRKLYFSDVIHSFATYVEQNYRLRIPMAILVKKAIATNNYLKALTI